MKLIPTICDTSLPITQLQLRTGPGEFVRKLTKLAILLAKVLNPQKTSTPPIMIEKR